jgi:hypothetical protein
MAHMASLRTLLVLREDYKSILDLLNHINAPQVTHIDFSELDMERNLEFSLQRDHGTEHHRTSDAESVG